MLLNSYNKGVLFSNDTNCLVTLQTIIKENECRLLSRKEFTVLYDDSIIGGCGNSGKIQTGMQCDTYATPIAVEYVTHQTQKVPQITSLVIVVTEDENRSGQTANIVNNATLLASSARATLRTDSSGASTSTVLGTTLTAKRRKCADGQPKPRKKSSASRSKAKSKPHTVTATSQSPVISGADDSGVAADPGTIDIGEICNQLGITLTDQPTTADPNTAPDPNDSGIAANTDVSEVVQLCQEIGIVEDAGQTSTVGITDADIAMLFGGNTPDVTNVMGSTTNITGNVGGISDTGMPEGNAGGIVSGTDIQMDTVGLTLDDINTIFGSNN